MNKQEATEFLNDYERRCRQLILAAERNHEMPGEFIDKLDADQKKIIEALTDKPNICPDCKNPPEEEPFSRREICGGPNH